jgi:hypothetical protein
MTAAYTGKVSTQGGVLHRSLPILCCVVELRKKAPWDPFYPQSPAVQARP